MESSEAFHKLWNSRKQLLEDELGIAERYLVIAFNDIFDMALAVTRQYQIKSDIYRMQNAARENIHMLHLHFHYCCRGEQGSQADNRTAILALIHKIDKLEEVQALHCPCTISIVSLQVRHELAFLCQRRLRPYPSYLFFMQDASAASHLLVPYEVRQLSAAVQSLRMRVDSCTKATLPKKRFAFSQKGVRVSQKPLQRPEAGAATGSKVSKERALTRSESNSAVSMRMPSER